MNRRELLKASAGSVALALGFTSLPSIAATPPTLEAQIMAHPKVQAYLRGEDHGFMNLEIDGHFVSAGVEELARIYSYPEFFHKIYLYDSTWSTPLTMYSREAVHNEELLPYIGHEVEVMQRRSLFKQFFESNTYDLWINGERDSKVLFPNLYRREDDYEEFDD